MCIRDRFEIDFEALEMLVMEERAIRAGALASFYYDTLLSRDSVVPPSAVGELQRLLDCHFVAMNSIGAFEQSISLVDDNQSAEGEEQANLCSPGAVSLRITRGSI
eukprot:TRINITY_DN38742_c0_g1_i1.p1 TRINITY_DN38742_c0_g1~~TRINITY_DN38742_c0_g1_i1.p1  ORF type:complete len:106 (+),score=16.86 TRINITY_DN38742_c0_g1_i1:144-461(+)